MKPLFALAVLSAWPLLANAANARERFGAIPEQTLSPRYYLDASPLVQLGKRQTACRSGQHPCDDIGISACCGNDHYCYLKPNGDGGCCAIGSNCDSLCPQSKVQCNGTSTITTGSATTTSLFAACCGRRCPNTSVYGCAESLGGGCCSYGQTCASNKQCLGTATSSSSIQTLVPQVPEGCTRNQIGCPSSLGGGCCANTQVCTSVDGSAMCAEATVVPTASGVSIVQDTELSTGGKAGVAVGVVVGAAIIIGVVTWWCIRRRKSRRSQTASIPHIVGGGGRAMTETNSEAVSRGMPPQGITQDYFTGAGPYTDHAIYTDVTSVGTSAVDRGVPLAPHDPTDIAAPVEIDSHGSPSPGKLGPDETVSQGSRSNRSSVHQPVPESIQGRFELYGDYGTSATSATYFPSPSTETPQMQTPPEHPLPHSSYPVQTPQTEELYETPMSGPVHPGYTGPSGQS